VRSHFTSENRDSHEGKAGFCLLQASFGSPTAEQCASPYTPGGIPNFATQGPNAAARTHGDVIRIASAGHESGLSRTCIVAGTPPAANALRVTRRMAA
jgi:hypothetical protein